MNFKVLIIGEGSVGKASFINICKNKGFQNTGPLNTYLDISTNHGNVRLLLTQSRTYEAGYDLDLIMYDSNNPSTMKILQIVPNNNVPKVVIRNKFDLVHKGKYPKVQQGTFTSRQYPYFNMSVKKLYGINEVLMCVLKELISKDVELY